MLDLNKPDELERYLRAGDECKRYNSLSKKSNYKRYVSFDMKHKRMNIVPEHAPGAAESYPLGNLLLDFANLNLSEYAQEWQKATQIIADPNTEYVEHGSYVGLNTEEKISPKDLQYNQLVCIDRLLKRFQHIHPYLLVPDRDYMTLTDHSPIQLLQTELDLIALQEEIKKYIELCLNDQTNAFYSQILPTQRYLLHHRTEEQLPFFESKSTLYVRDTNQKDAAMPGFSREQINYLKKTVPGTFDEGQLYERLSTESMVRMLRGNLIVEEGYAVQTVRDIAILELSRMIIANIRVRRCAFCGKLFMPVGKHDTRYCNRIPEGHTRNCQSIGSARDYAEKMRQNGPDTVYNKEYKRRNYRKQKGAMTETAFRNWQGYAQQQLGRCQSGEIGLEEFRENISR